MDFWQVIKKRHCARSFDSDRDVSDELINKVISAAKRAPSAGNMQDWRFKVVRDPGTKKQLAQAALGQIFIAQAPVIIVVCSDLGVAEQYYGERGVNLYAIQDIAAASQNLFLACVALGLSACWVGAFNENEVKNILNLPKSWRPMVIIPVGHEK